MKNDKVINVLKDLIQTLEDGKEGFRLAAESAKDADAKSIFTSYSTQRANFSSELHRLAGTHGDAGYDQSSSVAGALHRGWINLKSALTSGDIHAVLAECERGEDHAVSEYRKALEADLPMDVRSVVEQQAVEIKAAHDKIKELRDLAHAA